MIIEALERDLPPATLLLGPDLEQMVRAAKWSTNRSGVLAADRIILRHVSAADARNLVRFAQTAPFGPFKLVIACLDGATPVAQNILLKVLEEPPGTIRFILAATERPLPTIVSRCQVITVPAAGPAAEPGSQVTGKVTAVLKAAAAADLGALDRELSGWDHAHHAVLSLLLAEVAGGQADYGHGLDKSQARKLIGALSRFDSAHPRLAAHAALVSVLSDKEHHA